MDSPRSGLRRARATSWALVGLGVAGVAGTSTLAYADTVKPPATQEPVVAADPVPAERNPLPDLDGPAAPGAVTTTTDPAPLATSDPLHPVTPEPTIEQAPVTDGAPVPDSTPKYAPQQTYQPAPAPITHAPATPPTTKRRNLTPSTVMAPNYSPPITVSRGS